MPRYGIRVNYADSPYDRVMPAIGDAISAYQAHQDANRTEANQIAAQGGTPVGPAPESGMDRLRKVGGFLRKKVLGQTDPGAPPAPEPPFVNAGTGETPVTAQVPAAQGVTQPGGASMLGMPPRRIGDAIMNDPGMTASSRRSNDFFGGAGPAAAADAAPIVRSGPGNQPQPPNPMVSPGAGSIGAALSPYTITSASGQKYQIDPNRQANAARAQHDIKGAERDKDQQQQIDALVSAGMSPAVARAKVLNNVVKYDETYGQQRPGAMNQKDRMAVQDRIDARLKQSQNFALQLEQMRQQGRTGTREFQQLTAQLRALSQDDANDRAVLAADEQEAARSEKAVTTLQTNPVVSATPAGQAAIAGAQGAAAAAREKAAASRGKVAGKTPASQRVAGGTKPTINQAQYEAARAKINPATKQPYTDAEIMQHYNIDASVKRK